MRKGKDVRLESMASPSPSPRAARRRLHYRSSWSPRLWFSRRTSRRLPLGSDPEGRRCGFVPGRGGSGMAKPGPFLFRAVSNRTAIPGPTWLRTGPCRSGQIRPRSGPFRAKTNEALRHRSVTLFPAIPGQEWFRCYSKY